jgi:hypothetical protein
MLAVAESTSAIEMGASQQQTMCTRLGMSDQPDTWRLRNSERKTEKIPIMPRDRLQVKVAVGIERLTPLPSVVA